MIFISVSINSAVCDGQTLPYRSFDQLSVSEPSHFVQTASGALFVNSHERAFLYNGQRFLPIGEAQGVSGNAVFNDIQAGPGGHSLVGSQDGRLLVASDVGRYAYQDLHFSPVVPADPSRDWHFWTMANYGQGVVVVSDTRMVYLDLSIPEKPHLTDLPAQISNANGFIAHPGAIFTHGQDLWAGTTDGRICVVGPGLSRCWDEASGLLHERWYGFAAMPSGEIVARSLFHMVWLDPARGSVDKLVSLPDTVAGVNGYSLRTFVTKTGDIVTQVRDGIATLHNGTWTTLVLTDNAARISALYLDDTHSIWLGRIGVGITQFFGYGVTENWRAANGLSSDIVWGAGRQADGRMIIATDAGLDVMSPDSPVHAALESRSTKAMVIDQAGGVWLDIDSNIVEYLKPETGERAQWHLPAVNGLRIGKNGWVWLATSYGLYHIDPAAPDRGPVLSSSADLRLVNLSIDAEGTLWLIGDDGLWRASADATQITLVTRWPEQNISPLSVLHQLGGPVWVGTLNGLYRVDLAAGAPAISRVPPEHLPAQSIMALMLHSDGDLWVGTIDGVAILHGNHWFAADMFDGLIANDVAQDVMYEDQDHSVWIGTSRGLTHLLDPHAFCVEHVPELTVFSADVDGRPYRGAELPYQFNLLTVLMGIEDDPRSSRMHFQVRLDGLDQTWTTTPNDTFVYPSLPSGRHTLMMRAYDPVQRTASLPQTLTVFVDAPWWRQPWAYGVAALLCVAVLWSVLRVRTRYLLRQRQTLASQVKARTRELESRTMELEEARQRLEVLAHRDGLTGLLNRRAVRSAFPDLVYRSDGALSVGLLDVDHFKRINDTYGHLGGDAVLVEIARRFEAAFETGEIAGRFGGEEYVVLIPGPTQLALGRLRRICHEIADQPVMFGSRAISFTVSGGLAALHRGESWEQVLARADDALYQAKHRGRNLVVEAELSSLA